jgi:hypothetical protein
MYSNLRNYGGGNHYLVPMAILSHDLLFGGGLVQVVHSTSAALNRRLAYVSSKDLFPPTTLRYILSRRTSIADANVPIQYFPLCVSNPHSWELMMDLYETSNPAGSANFAPFLLPISSVRQALGEAKRLGEKNFVVHLAPAGNSTHIVEEISHQIVIRDDNSCQILSSDGHVLDGDCQHDEIANLVLYGQPRRYSGLLQAFVDKTLTPYPQLVGWKEEICMA